MTALSKREFQVLELLAGGFLYKEIADQLSLSFETVHTYIRRIYEKLEVRSRTQAVVRFFQLQNNQPQGKYMSPEHTAAILAVLEKAQSRLALAIPDRDAGAIAFQIQQAREGIGRAMLMLRLVNKPAQTGTES